MEGRTSAQVLRMIDHAVRAGAFRAGARNYPQASATFMAAAELNSAKAATLASAIATAGPGKVPAARMRR